ncbi:MAG: ribosome maturation factor RimM [Rhodospirillales bacterium]|nr:ribosome maturation factor RimM [Rhodospirillales bacterium]
MPEDNRVLVGVIAGAHGVRGEVRIRSFTADPADVAAYGPVSDESGARRFAVRIRSAVRGQVIARLDGVADRNAAESLKGLRLYVPRDTLPRLGKDEWYLADLIGLRAEDTAGKPLGRVKAVHNFGAGDVLEIEGAGGATQFLSFTRRAVPEVDIAGGRIVIEPPVEVEAKGEAANEADDASGRRT